MLRGEALFVICQLATNGVLAGANGDIIRAANTSYILVAKATVSDNMKAAILLDRANV